MIRITKCKKDCDLPLAAKIYLFSSIMPQVLLISRFVKYCNARLVSDGKRTGTPLPTYKNIKTFNKIKIRQSAACNVNNVLKLPAQLNCCHRFTFKNVEEGKKLGAGYNETCNYHMILMARLYRVVTFRHHDQGCL